LPEENMIHVEHLQKSFGALRAVDGISFSVRERERFGFLGPNGAGKTTTLSMISGLLRPDAGRVRIGDLDVWENPQQAKRLLGLVPQDLALYEELTALENLRFWGGLYHLPKRDLEDSIAFWLERVGLAERAKDRVSTYSGGMKRRLNLAAGMVHHPKVVLLDEPTVGIDPQARSAILELIREIAHNGTTVLFTTHHLEEAEALCERIAIMDHGQMLSIGTVDELAKSAGDADIITLHGRFTGEQLQRLFAQEPVEFLTLKDQYASFTYPRERNGISALLKKMSDDRIEISDITLQKPSLENVFLKLTGRELRD
jgi:ABC-2 type transport system ATP-binding protein